jgi:hypothetical protein
VPGPVHPEGMFWLADTLTLAAAGALSAALKLAGGTRS